MQDERVITTEAGERTEVQALEKLDSQDGLLTAIEPERELQTDHPACEIENHDIKPSQPEETASESDEETTVQTSRNGRNGEAKIYTHEADDHAWRLIYTALRNNNPLTKYPAMSVEEIADQKCLVIYIPDPLTGVKGILPEKYAGLREREKLESLMSYPFLRVLPVSVDRENNIVILRRDRAEAIYSARAWKNIKEGDIVDGVVTGVDRSDSGLANRIYLDVEAIRAILPIGEVSHNYTEDVDYRRGDIIRVKVLKKNEFEKEDGNSRVLLVSVRALTPDPWELEHCIPVVKMPYFGTVVNIVQTGMFVRLASGIEVKTPHPSLNYRGNIRVGDRIRVYPVIVNREERRVYGVLTESEMKRTIRNYELRRRRKERKSSGLPG